MMQLHKHIFVKQRIPNVVISRSGESLFGAQQPNNTISSLLIMQATCLKCSTFKFVCNTGSALTVQMFDKYET